MYSTSSGMALSRGVSNISTCRCLFHVFMFLVSCFAIIPTDLAAACASCRDLFSSAVTTWVIKPRLQETPHDTALWFVDALEALLAVKALKFNERGMCSWQALSLASGGSTLLQLPVSDQTPVELLVVANGNRIAFLEPSGIQLMT